MEIDFDELDALEELERQNAALLSELDLEASTNGMQPPVINCNRIWAMSDVSSVMLLACLLPLGCMQRSDYGRWAALCSDYCRCPVDCHCATAVH